MSRTKKMLLILMASLALATGLTACNNDATTVNKNLSTDADNFKVLRRVVFYNAINDKYILAVEGFCSVDPGDGRRMTVTCKVGNEYKRDALGTSDNVLWWYEQLETSNVSPTHYKIILKPSEIIPGVEFR